MSSRITEISKPRLREIWEEKLRSVPPKLRAYFAISAARRVQMLFEISARAIPDHFRAIIQDGLTFAEQVVIGASAEIDEAAARAGDLSTHLARYDFGPVPFSVALCSHFAILAAAREDNLSLAANAIDLAASTGTPIHPNVRNSILQAIERDFERLIEEFISDSPGQIMRPSEFVWSQAAFPKHAKLTSIVLSASSVVNETLIKRLRDYPGELYRLSPHAFEDLIAEIFTGLGFEVEPTKRTRDGGRDLIAVKYKPLRLRCFIECKRHSPENKVDVGIVRELLGVLHDDRGSNAILATTSFFTAPAKEFVERNKWQLEGRDFHGIVDWLRDYQRERLIQLQRG